jgi:hypothetical protein
MSEEVAWTIQAKVSGQETVTLPIKANFLHYGTGSDKYRTAF